MSIIADTLKRLQACSTPTTSDVSEEPSSRPLVSQGKVSGQNLKASGMKFWIIGVGMTVGLAGLAFSAFWIGLQIDFGLSANTHARMDNSRSISTPPLPAEIQVANQEPLGTVISSAPEVVQPSPTPTSQPNEEQALQTSMIEIDNSPTQDTSSPQTHLESQPVAPPPKAPVIRKSFEQQVNSNSEVLADKDNGQIAPGESGSEEPPALEELVRPPTPEVEPPYIVEMDIEEAQGLQIAPPGTVALEEEFVDTEELVKIAKLSTNPTYTPSNFTTLKKRREGMNLVGQSTALLQPSSANRLHHARELIQAGQYEEAVALLSPLFHEPPVKWQPWFWMGTALLGQEDLEQADQFFLSGLARNDKIPQLWIQRALVAQQRGNYQLAVHELRQAESLEPDLPHIHLNMGYAYERLGNIQLANQYYGKFLKLSEGNPDFFSTRKKLFARVIQQTQMERPLPPTVSSFLND